MTDLEKVLGKTGARKFWDKVWGNVKILTGDVAYNTKGDLQTQINAVADTASTAKTTADAAKTAAEDAKVAAGEIVTDTTDKFDSTKDYAVGDYVIYDNKAWKFTTVHPAGAWDESHVEQTNILAEIAAQNKNLKVDGDMTIGEMIEKIYNAINSRNTYQLKTIGVIDGNGSFSIPDENKKSFIIAIPTEVKVSTNRYGNCRLDGSFYGTSPSWEYNENDKVVTTSKSSWTICNDSGSIITGSIRWTIYAIE